MAGRTLCGLNALRRPIVLGIFSLGMSACPPESSPIPQKPRDFALRRNDASADTVLQRQSARLRDVVRLARIMGRQSRPYAAPDEQQLAAARQGLTRLLAGEVHAASQTLASIGMELAYLSDGKARYYVVREAQASPLRGWGLFVVRARGSQRPYVLEVPHPRNDRHTVRQGAELMRQLHARALLISTAYRCAARQPSNCPGRTVACGGKRVLRRYRLSDMAHTTRSFFHVAHEVLLAADPAAIAVQLHGFDRRPGRTIHLQISDGTNLPGGRRNLANRLTRLLQRALGRASLVASCNAPHGARLPALCGTQNVQGKHANRAKKPCRGRVRRSTNRFLHVEQSLDARTKAGALDRAALSAALSGLVPRRPRHSSAVRDETLRRPLSVVPRRRPADRSIRPN